MYLEERGSNVQKGRNRGMFRRSMKDKASGEKKRGCRPPGTDWVPSRQTIQEEREKRGRGCEGGGGQPVKPPLARARQRPENTNSPPAWGLSGKKRAKEEGEVLGLARPGREENDFSDEFV